MPPHFTPFFPSFLPPLVTRMQQRHILFSPPTRRGYRKNTANPPPSPLLDSPPLLTTTKHVWPWEGLFTFRSPPPLDFDPRPDSPSPPPIQRPPRNAIVRCNGGSSRDRGELSQHRRMHKVSGGGGARLPLFFFLHPPPSRPTTLTPFSPLPSPYLIVSRDEKRREERHLLLPPDVLQSSSLDVTTHDATLSYNVMPIRPSRHSGPTPFITSVTLPACDKSGRECGERKWPTYREQMRPHISK